MNRDDPPQPVPPAETPPDIHSGLMARFRNYFLTGLIVAGPIAITFYLTWWFVTWVDGIVRPFVPIAYRPETYLPFNIPGTGLVIAFVTLTLLGFLTANLVGKTLVEFGESVLSRMPVVRPIYRTMKQIFETVFSKDGSSFRNVGLMEFPAPGMWSLVFLSQPPSGDLTAKLPPGEHVSAFMPCTPNPTTGFFFYVLRKDLVVLDISVENAMTLLISAGMVQPDSGEGAQKNLAALAATARAAQVARKTEAAE